MGKKKFIGICNACSLVNEFGRMAMLSFIGNTIFRTLVTLWLAINFGIFVRESEDIKG